jgi:hypothetical protein
MNLTTQFSKTRIVAILGLTLLLLALIIAPGFAEPQVTSISGTVTYYGPVAGDHHISVALFLNPSDTEPVTSDDLPGRSVDYEFSGGPAGVYYVSAYFDADDSGGPPGPGEPLAWYDGDGDGQPDGIAAGSEPVQGIDIALGEIIYVDGSAGGGNDGSSWSNAYANLQTALGAASSGSELWIAAGTYKPTTSTSRTATFQLKSGVGLYGGFAGTELLRSQRDWRARPTILSGDIGAIGVKTDNSYNVVTGSGVNNTSRLDGVVITGGYANGAGIYDKGGGLQITGGSPIVANVNFIDNWANNHGAGMSTQQTGSTPLVINCLFSGNGTNFNGAMANLWYANTTVINSSFTGNSGGNAGGIVNLEQGASVMRNVIFWNNGSREILLHNGGTIDIQYSIIKGDTVYAGTGNKNADPFFVDADGPDGVYGTLDDDLSLAAGSPAVDAGNNSAVPADASDMDGDGNAGETLPQDMAGRPRFVDTPLADSGSGSAPIVDMGAMEQLNLSLIPLVIRN